MDRDMIEILLDNIGSPALAANNEGRILMQNRHMHHIRIRLDNKELETLNDMELQISRKINSKVYKIYIKGTDLKGLMYNLTVSDDSEVSVIIFESGIVKGNLIENIIEHIDEVVVIFNKDGVLERMNSMCDQMLPFKRKDVIGKPVSELVAKGFFKSPIIDKLIETKEKVYKDITYSNGKIISYTAVPIFGSSGNFRGGVLTGRDVSRIINLAKTISTNDEVTEYISDSEKIKEIKSMISRVAPSDASIFLLGESGVGKEVLAKSIWSQSMRSDKPFVAINCAAIPAELIESELFGYEKGAFTGANAEGKVGLIEAADGGTLFLDEIGEMSLEIQKKLLRVLQERKIQRIGGIESKKVDVRFISATNKTTEEILNPQIFRQDLYYRLSVIPLQIPSLKERKEDIHPLCDFYLDFYNKKYGRNIRMEDDSFGVLKNYDWPGNIRELKNIIERLVVLTPYENVSAEQMARTLDLGTMEKFESFDRKKDFEQGVMPINQLNEEHIDLSQCDNIEAAYKMVEETMLKKAMSKHGNISKAAQSIGINPSTVYRKIKSGKISLD